MPSVTKLDAAAQRVQECVERAYAVFPATLSGAHGRACPCCTSQAEVAALWSAQRRTLSANELGNYSAKAMTTWGTADDYRYFLPRILELMTTREARSWMGLDVQLIDDKLVYGEWEKWPPAERDVLRAFFLASFLHTVASGDGDGMTATLHLWCGLRHAVDTAPYWEPWQSDDYGAQLHLVSVVEMYDPVGDSSWWDDTWRGHPRAAEVHAFLADPSVADRLERVARANPPVADAVDDSRYDSERMIAAAEMLRSRFTV